MLQRFIFAFAAMLLFGHSTNSADANPITNYAQQEAPVRSGPGERFYPTQILSRGAPVEVYRTTDDGWCAIRPPKGSFSWVPINAVAPSSRKGIVKTIRPDVRTRVGSQLEPQNREVLYVTLNSGEALRTIGRSDDGRWIKIAPPSGEFRWIHKKYLGDSRPIRRQNDIAPANYEQQQKLNTTIESHVSMSEANPPKISSPATAIPASDTVGSSVRNPSRENDAVLSQDGILSPQDDATSSDLPIERQPETIDQDLVANAEPIATSRMSTEPIVLSDSQSSEVESGLQPIVGSKQAGQPVGKESGKSEDQQWQSRESSFTDVRETPLKKVASPGSHSQRTFDRDTGSELEQIRSALAQTVSKETKSWDLSPLRQRAENIIDHESHSQHRAVARKLLRRISEFEKVKQRYDELARVGNSELRSHVDSPPAPRATRKARQDDDTGLSDVELASFLKTDNRSSSSTGSQKPNRVRAGGWLVPVLTNDPKMPKFALTDKNGQITQFVVPDGVVLKPYMRKHIQLLGRAASRSKMNKPTLIVSEVIVR